MQNRNYIIEELNELSPLLAGMEKVNAFSIPDGYFNSLSDAVMESIKMENDSVINEISKDTLLKVPEGYFDNLSGQILNKIKDQQTISAVDELRSLSPMLYSIQNENVFEAPVGYFNALAGDVLNKVKPQPAKVVIMHKRRAFFKYAVAAAVTGVIALGTFKFIAKPGRDAAPASLDAYIVKGLQMNDKQFNDSLNNLSDDEIANYLDKNGNEEDIAALSSSLDDNSLPNADDYLSDDKTLDNYLNDVPVKTTDNN